MITTLTWVSIITGGILILLMLISLISGLDLDMDLDLEMGSTDVETDAGGVGVIKGLLIFVSVTSWVIKIFLASDRHPGLAIAIGIFAGVLAFILLNFLFRLLLRNEENVNWNITDALNQEGTVYLKIPVDGSGIVNININGTQRELKAKSYDNTEIKTGSSIVVMSVEGEYAIVRISNV